MDSDQLKAILPEVVALIETAAPYGAALAMRFSGMSIAMDNREQRATRDPESMGVVLTAAHGGYLVEYATTTLDREGLLTETRAWLTSLPTPSADTAVGDRSGAAAAPGLRHADADRSGDRADGREVRADRGTAGSRAGA